MFSNEERVSIKILVAVTFAIMIIVNAMANILPINGQTTGRVSDSYPNLFAPAPVTFAIWGVIYLLLACFILYQIGFFRDAKSLGQRSFLSEIGVYFSISSLANAGWIFSWHYHLIGLSMLLMVVILICLILINQKIKSETLLKKEEFFIGLPFSIYFGWITVATIANATALLVSLSWNGFGLSPVIWTVIILVVGLIIGIATIVKHRDMAYGLVFIWAYAGILIKHRSIDGFSGEYLGIITTLIVCLAFLVIAEIYVLLSKGKK